MTDATDTEPDPHRIDELDLLALADGQLDHDPARRAAVEARLARSPGAAARARAFAAQTAALRRAYGHRIAEPVPDRLHAALEGRPARPGRAALRAAAAVLLTAGAAAGGWLLGQGNDPEGWSVAVLLDRSHAQFAAAGPMAESGGAAPQVHARPLGLLTDAVSIRIGAPDLSAAGYTLVDTRAVAADGESNGDRGQIVRLDYAAPGGRAFSLFLSPRWDARRREMRQLERDGVSLAYWLEGPLATALVTHLPAAEASVIAARVRDAMRNGTASAPVMEPEPGGAGSPVTGSEEAMAGSSAAGAADAGPAAAGFPQALPAVPN